MYLEKLDSGGLGRFAFLAYDQGLEHGPHDFLPNPSSASPRFILELARDHGYSAVVFQQGVALAVQEICPEVPRLVKLNGKANLAKGEPDSRLLCSVEFAVRVLGGRGVGYTLYPGSEHEGRMFAEFAEVVREARQWQVPVVAWVYPRGRAVPNDTAPEVIAYAARIAFELGADVAKIKWSGDRESFRWACEVAQTTRVVLSGGVKTEDPKEFLDVVSQVLEAGGAGVAVGRNVWQRPPDQARRVSEEIVSLIRRARW